MAPAVAYFAVQLAWPASEADTETVLQALRAAEHIHVSWSLERANEPDRTTLDMLLRLGQPRTAISPARYIRQQLPTQVVVLVQREPMTILNAKVTAKNREFAQRVMKELTRVADHAAFPDAGSPRRPANVPTVFTAVLEVAALPAAALRQIYRGIDGALAGIGYTIEIGGN